MLLTAKTYPNLVRIDRFLRDLQLNQIFRQTNFKMSHNNEINNDIKLKRSALKVYAYTYKSQHSFKRYREMKEQLVEKSEKKYLNKYLKKYSRGLLKKSFSGISRPNFKAINPF